MTPKQREHRRGWGARQGLILPALQAVGMSYLNEFIPHRMDEKPLKSFKVGGWHNPMYMLRKLHRWLHGGCMGRRVGVWLGGQLRGYWTSISET